MKKLSQNLVSGKIISTTSPGTFIGVNVSSCVCKENPGVVLSSQIT